MEVRSYKSGRNTHSCRILLGHYDFHRNPGPCRRGNRHGGSPTALGKTFKGDYANSPAYIMEVMNDLARLGIESLPNQTIGVYYDDPSKKEAQLLMSFQGVFVTHTLKEVPSPFIQFSFSGKYLYIKLTGMDVMRMIYEGYNMLFNFIKTNSIKLKSPTGYQIFTNTGDGIVAEILLEIEK